MLLLLACGGADNGYDVDAGHSCSVHVGLSDVQRAQIACKNWTPYVVIRNGALTQVYICFNDEN